MLYHVNHLVKQVFIVVWTSAKLSIQFTAGRLLHFIKTRAVCLGNHYIRVTPVNRRTALWVFVEIESISMSFRDNMNGKFCSFILRYIYVTERYTASLNTTLRHVTQIFLVICSHVIRWYLGTCFQRILMEDKTVLSSNLCFNLLCYGLHNDYFNCFNFVTLCSLCCVLFLSFPLFCLL